MARRIAWCAVLAVCLRMSFVGSCARACVAGLHRALWMLPREAAQQRERVRKRDGPLVKEAATAIVAGHGAHIDQHLLAALREAQVTARRTREDEAKSARRVARDACDALDLVVFAGSITDNQAWLNTVLREVRFRNGGSLRGSKMDVASLPALAKLIEPGYYMRGSPEHDAAKEILELLRPAKDSTDLFLGDALQAAKLMTSADDSSTPLERLEVALALLDAGLDFCSDVPAQNVSANDGEPEPALWPGTQALSFLVAGCCLAGATYMTRAKELAQKLRVTAAREGCSLDELLQPAFCETVMQLLDQPRATAAPTTGKTTAWAVQRAAQAAVQEPAALKDMRHGAVLLGPDGTFLAVGANRKVRLASGRRMQIHAELDALLRLPSADLVSQGRCVVVQLDDFGVSFLDSHPCRKGCRQALQRAGLREVLYTTGRSGGLAKQAVVANDVVSNSLAYIELHGGLAEKSRQPAEGQLATVESDAAIAAR
eukprot:TRINITY_DN80826_c0_g1_i1.p1 TRINITY_DN80826_c0_g1~~TRINITY_DN80826_c0_g1_i1.p1  ORF type:complete len:487 (+),score=67.35 TRINITY_DN80826_c0_g1_i1:98-1558(+)